MLTCSKIRSEKDLLNAILGLANDQREIHFRFLFRDPTKCDVMMDKYEGTLGTFIYFCECIVPVQIV